MPRQRPVSRNDIREEEEDVIIPNACSPIEGNVPEFDYEEIVQAN